MTGTSPSHELLSGSRNKGSRQALAGEGSHRCEAAANVRPHARQRKSGTSSSFFLRVPFLMRRLLLQCGQRSGGLIVERRDAARGAELVERFIVALFIVRPG